MITVENNQIREKTIDININNNITISLRNDEYDELIEKLNLSMLEKLKKSDLYIKKIEKKENDCINFIKDISNIFYIYYDYSDVFFKKTISEIDQEKLFEILKKYNKLLGLEE